MPDSRSLLHDLLSKLGEPREVAPGVFGARLPLGKHKLGVEVEIAGDGLALRVFPEDVLPDELREHPAVHGRLPALSDLVRCGELRRRDQDGRLILEVEVPGGMGEAQRVLLLLRQVTIDCARLRGAAEGLAATAELEGAQTATTSRQELESSDELAPLMRPDPARSDPMRADPSATLLSFPALAAEAPLSEAAGGIAETRRKGARFTDQRARLVVMDGPGAGESYLLEGRETFIVGRSPDVDITLRDQSVSRQNSRISWIEDTLWIEDLGSSNGTSVNGEQVTKAEMAAGDTIEVGETRMRVERVSLAGESSLGLDAPLLSDLVTGKTAEEERVEAVERARRYEEEVASEKPAAAAPAPPPPPASKEVGWPGAAAKKQKDDKSYLGGSKHAATRLRSRANEFFTMLNPDEPERTGDSGLLQRLMSPDDAAESPEPVGPGVTSSSDSDIRRRFQSRTAQFDSLLRGGSADGLEPIPGRPEEPEAPEMASTEDVENALSWMMGDEEEEEEEGAEVDSSAIMRGISELESAPAKPDARSESGDMAGSQRLSGRLLRQGDEVLAWMDECEEEPLGPIDLESDKRRRGFAIPKALLPSLRKIARDWYRHPERTTLSGEVRAEGESIWVQSGYATGESSWRYRQPVLRLGRPPLSVAHGVYVPEPTELSHEEVASWLLSENLIDEEEVESRRRAQQLREDAWIHRADGDADGALTKLEEVLELFPDDVLALTSIGHLCRKELAAPERAYEYYARALELAPRFAPALLGQAMLLLPNDRHRAAEASVQALALAPDDPDALELAGLVTLRAGRRARAREVFLRLYRKDRERGRRALSLIDAERGGSTKWDPRLVMVERRALDEGELDSITEALYKERVELADQLTEFVDRFGELTTDEKVRRLSRLADAQSYSFFADLLEHYLDEPSAEVREAIHDTFLRAPTPAALALEDAMKDGEAPDRAVAAVAVASHLRWRDLLPHALELFRQVSLPREVSRFIPHLVRFSGPEVALALLAKLERGVDAAREALLKMLEDRPNAPAEEAALVLREVLSVPGAVEISDADFERLEQSVASSAQQRRSSGQLI